MKEYEMEDGGGGRWRRKQMEEDEVYEGGLRTKNIVEYEEEGGWRRIEEEGRCGGVGWRRMEEEG